jgi:hypothetical protein
MLNDRWAKRIMRAAKADVIIGSPDKDIIESRIIDRQLKDEEAHQMTNLVKDNEKIMDYLQRDNKSGWPHNLDMLLASLNVHQHLREAFLSSSVTEDAENNCYIISFPFGIKTIEYKLNKKAVDAE